MKKICQTLQSNVKLHRTISYLALSSRFWSSRLASCFKEQVSIFSAKAQIAQDLIWWGHKVLLLHHSGQALLASTLNDWLPMQEKIGHSVWLLRVLLFKEGQVTAICFDPAGRPVNPFKLEVHSETTWPTPKCRHFAQCASFLLLDFWLSKATEKASRLMLVERRPMMLLGASWLFTCVTIQD